MMYRSTLIATLLAAASAAKLTTKTKAGAKLLSKARRVNQNQEEDFAWMADYSLKFEGCHTIHTAFAEGEGGGNEEGASNFGAQRLAKFSLCSSDKSCGSCRAGGEYMVRLDEFAQAYLEADQEIKATKCNAVEENCNCNYYYGDDQACLNKCYAEAGLDYCVEEENDFDIAEYMECTEAEFGNNNNNGNGYAYYIGPLCSHGGKSVRLAVFTDAQCTEQAPSGTYENYNYGYTLPYSKSNMIGTDCLSCKQDDGDNNNNNNGNYYYNAAEPMESCTQLYEQSAKCERKMSAKNKYTRDTGGCMYIHKIVPALENVYHRQGGGSATFFAVFFSLTTIAAAAAAYFFYSQVERSTVNLTGKGGSYV